MTIEIRRRGAFLMTTALVGASLLVMAGKANAADAGQTQNGGVETVVVTAEKHAESELSVPMAITAISGEELTRHAQTRFEDYVNTVPGVQLNETGLIGATLIIRGLSTGTASISPSSAIYIDNTPYTIASAAAGGFESAPNLDTYDMQRIEVLKGPQGTLYGANALGGLLKYVTNAPDPSAFAASVQAGTSEVYNGGGPGFDLHGMVNIPLADNFAVRAVAFDNYYPGFIDNNYLGLKDINGSHVTGGRVALLWQPRSDLTVRLMGLAQHLSYSDMSSEYVYGATGSPHYNPAAVSPCSAPPAPVACPAGPLVLNNYISQPGKTDNDVASLDINWDAGFANLISTTSFIHFLTQGIWDYSGPLGSTVTQALGSGTFGAAVYDNRPTDAWTEEVRLVSPQDQTLSWQVGGYFNNSKSSENEIISPIDAATGQNLTNFLPPSNLGTDHTTPIGYTEYAAYANVDYHVLPTFDVALGGRYATNNQEAEIYGSGPFFAALSLPLEQVSEHVFTWSMDARWHFTPDNMVYARWATGFGPGGPNDHLLTAPGLPDFFNPDTTSNYEVGIKGSLFDNTFTYQMAAYHIDWHDLQLEVLIGGFDTIANGGGAHSNGLEWEYTWLPLNGLTLKWSGDYNYASLSANTPEEASIGAFGGDVLPYAPHWQTTFAVEYEVPVFGDWSAFGGGDVRYTDDARGDYNNDPVNNNMRPFIPSYTMFDFQAGVENDKYSVTLYCKNCSNVIQTTADYAWNPVSNGAGVQNAAVFTPRTIGIDLAAKF